MRTGGLSGIAFLAISIAAGGCARITASVVEKPRVDQDPAGGNRGYLVGSAPPEGDRKGTRQIVQTDIELSTVRELIPWRRSKAQPPAAVPAAAPSFPSEPAPSFEGPAETAEQPVPLEDSFPEVAATTYTVQRGDTLEKIASKVYGNARGWQRIYQANRDRISSPSRIYPGQKLVIPPAEEPARRQTEPSGDFK